jgi:hypothetical protein
MTKISRHPFKDSENGDMQDDPIPARRNLSRQATIVPPAGFEIP